MGILKKFFGKSSTDEKQGEVSRPTSEIVSELVAKHIAETFSYTRFSEMFVQEQLQAGWSQNDALAVWYSLGNLALVNAAWHEYGDSPPKVNLVLDLVRPKLLKYWDMPQQTLDNLLSVVEESEAEAFKSFNACSNGIELHIFFSRYVSRILGAPVPFSKRSTLEDLLMGFENKGDNPIKNAALSRLFVNACSQTKQYLKNIPAEWASSSRNVATDVREERPALANKPATEKEESMLDTSDYGPVSMSPSKEAEVILELMSTDERSNFNDILARLQDWREKSAGQSGIIFHPEARGCLWGLALAKLAEHYMEKHLTERALFFMGAAWTISKYPVFANNAALLSISVGDNVRAKNLLQGFLSNYKAVPETQTFRLIEHQITLDELEAIAISARARLAAIESGTNPMFI